MAGLALAALVPVRALPAEPDDDCFLQPEVAHYVAAVQDRILDAWELPPDSMANREVVLVLSFGPDGRVRRARIIESNDTRLKRSVAAAVMRAAPFGPVPPDAACLVDRPIRTTFRNPTN